MIMKTTTFFLSAAFLTATTFFMGCSKKKSDPTPDNSNPNAPVVTSLMTTNNGGNSGGANASLDVSNSTGTAKLRLDVTNTSDLDKIYIMKCEDNGTRMPFTVSSLVSLEGKTFSGGSSTYSLAVPNNTKSFTIDIPVSIRSNNSAVTDVYYVWITNGSGDYNKPDKNTVLGPAVITLKYTSEHQVSYSTATTDVGTQSAVNSSFLVTSGMITTLSTSDYNDSPGSADIRFVSLDVLGKKNNGSSNVFMYSPNDLGAANPASDATADFLIALGSSTTYFANSSMSSSDFDNIDNGSDIQFPTLSSGNYIQVVAGGIYEFQTNDGKQGLIRINTLTADTDNTASGGYNANVTVKVIN
jgi:hypothetical protein